MQSMQMRIAALVAGMVGALVFVAPAQAAPAVGGGYNPCTYSMRTSHNGQLKTLVTRCPGQRTRVMMWRLTDDGWQRLYRPAPWAR